MADRVEQGHAFLALGLDAALRKHAYRSELAVAIYAVHEAATLCTAVQNAIGPGVFQKKDRSPVTVADFGAQMLICRAVHDQFPHDPIIAEEESAALRHPDNALLLDEIKRQVAALRPEVDPLAFVDWIDLGRTADYSDRFWTLDPIDGTKGFLRGEQYAVALALIVHGEPVVAALACPNMSLDTLPADAPGSIFVAVRGAGAARMSIGGRGEAVPIQVSEENVPGRVRFCESVESGHTAQGDSAAVAARLGMSEPPIRIDSQAKYALVATGGADAYLRLPTRPGYVERIWDHAAGALIVTEAGGRVTDISGRALEFRHGAGLKHNRGVVVTNGPLHERIIDAIRVLGLG